MACPYNHFRNSLHQSLFLDATQRRFLCPGPLIVDGVVVFAASFSIIAMFFLGPACAALALGQPLFGVVERSVGSIPDLGLRICGVLYMISFISELVEIPCRWWFWGCRMDVVASTLAVNCTCSCRIAFCHRSPEFFNPGATCQVHDQAFIGFPDRGTDSSERGVVACPHWLSSSRWVL